MYAGNVLRIKVVPIGVAGLNAGAFRSLGIRAWEPGKKIRSRPDCRLASPAHFLSGFGSASLVRGAGSRTANRAVRAANRSLGHRPTKNTQRSSSGWKNFYVLGSQEMYHASILNQEHCSRNCCMGSCFGHWRT